VANKLDMTRPLYMGPNAARENTVVDHIRRAVKALDTGSGVPYAKLEEYMLTNYTPAKSQNYSGSFVKSYVRDAVNKYGHLSHEDFGHDYATETAPAPKPRKPKRIGKAKQEVLSILEFIRTAGEVADAHDVDNTQIGPEDIASELGKRRNWVEEGLLRTEGEDGRTLVYLTAAGLAAINAAEPEGAASVEGADEGQPDTDDADDNTPDDEDADAEEATAE
jgi:hypothetical protein